VHLRIEGFVAAWTGRCNGTCLAIWIRPAFSVFHTADEVTDVVSATKILKDSVEPVHLDSRQGCVVCAVLWG
jgi:hypothetical protein